MIGLDWLRRKAAADVTRFQGSALPPDPEPTAERIRLAAAKDAADLAAEAVPTGFIEFNGTLTESEVEQIRQRFQITPRPFRSEPMRCTCVAIYSSCRCDKK